MAMAFGGLLPAHVLGAVLYCAHLAGGSTILPPNDTKVTFDSEGVATESVDAETLAACAGVPGFEVHRYLDQESDGDGSLVNGSLVNGCVGVIDFTDRPVTVRLDSGETTTGFFIAWADGPQGIALPDDGENVSPGTHLQNALSASGTSLEAIKAEMQEKFGTLSPDPTPPPGPVVPVETDPVTPEQSVAPETKPVKLDASTVEPPTVAETEPVAPDATATVSADAPVNADATVATTATTANSTETPAESVEDAGAAKTSRKKVATTPDDAEATAAALKALQDLTTETPKSE